MVNPFVRDNFVVVSNIIFLLVFLLTNTLFDKRVTKHFLRTISILILITIVENIDFALSLLPDPTMTRTLAAMFGYILRPFLIYSVILILKFDTKKEKLLVAIPAIINTLVELTTPFTHLTFWFDEDNLFARGPLGYTPHVCATLYLALFIVLSVQFFKERNYMEACILVTIAFICAVATVFESIGDYVGLLRAASGLSLTFFYLYYCAQSFKRDALTKVLNRHCFYRDAEKYKDKMIAVLSVDLNNLKKINDSEGHAAGDLAIVTTAECIRKHLIKGCYLYRTGGDEFMVLCPVHTATVEQLQEMMEHVYDEIKRTPYRCAIGMAEYMTGETFDALCARADEAMYEVKEKIKRAE